MIGTGIIFVLDADGHPQILRYVIGEKSTFTAHVGIGESLLIADEVISTELANGSSGPDPVKASDVLSTALASGTLRTILWQTP